MLLNILFAMLSATVLWLLMFGLLPTFYSQDRSAIGSHIIGLALTANHVTVSSRAPDGSFKDLGRIEGSEEYVDLIRRFTSWDTAHPRYV